MDTKLGYIVILPWMREELDLKGNELLVYALIHGFSQEAQGCFFGSLNYICRACGCTIPTTIEVLKKLQNRGLIHKRELSENNVKMCQYTAIKGGTKEILVPLKNLKGGTKEILVGGTKDSLPNNKDIDNKSIIKDKTPVPLILPFSSDKFRMTWEALCEEKEWKKKTRNALQLTLNKLAKYHEDFAIELMEATIESGKWQRVVFPDTDAKYQEWKSARQQSIDNQMPRTAQATKPKPPQKDNLIDQMYERMRQKKAEEARQLQEQIEQFKAQSKDNHGDSD